MQQNNSGSDFIKLLREKESAILAKMTEKRNECLNKLDENQRRLLSIIPKELLDMNAGNFLDRHECELDEMLMGSKRVAEFRRPNSEVRFEPPQEGRFNSPPKKNAKKVIIKKKQ